MRSKITTYLFICLFPLLGSATIAFGENLPAKTALELVEKGEYRASQALFEKVLEKGPQAEALLAKALWLRGKGFSMQAFELLEFASKRFPKQERLLLESVRTLSMLGAHQAAYAKALQFPHVFGKEALQALQLNISASYIRWDKRLSGSQETLSMPSAPMAEKILTTLPSSAESSRQRILLLILDKKYQSAIALYEQMKNEQPLWFLSWIASTYLELEQTEKALELLKKTDGSSESLLLQLRALLQAGETEKARERLYHLREKFGPEMQVVQGVAETNWDRIDLELETPWITAATGDLEQAHKEIQQFSSMAPLHSGLISQSAEISRWQGRLYEALETQSVAQQLDPKSSSMRLSLANTLLDLNDISAADSFFQSVPASETMEYKEVRRRFRLLHSETLSSYVYFSRPEPSVHELFHSHRLDSRILSASLPLSLFAEWERKSETEASSFQRAQAGLHLLLPYGTEAELAVTFPQNQEDIGLKTQIKTLPANNWSIGLSFDNTSTELPAYALTSGIHSKSAEIYLHKQFNEWGSLKLSASGANHSDGNHHRELGALMDMKIYTNANAERWLGWEASAGTNSKEDAEYFSPSSDLSLLGKLSQTWRHDRLFSKKFSQTVELALGLYKQSGESSLPIGWLRYGHEWEITQGTSLEYSVQARQQAFDGESTIDGAFELSLRIPLSLEAK